MKKTVRETTESQGAPQVLLPRVRRWQQGTDACASCGQRRPERANSDARQERETLCEPRHRRNSERLTSRAGHAAGRKRFPRAVEPRDE